MLGLSYTIILTLLWFIKVKTYNNLVRILVLILLFQGYYLWHFKGQSKTEFIVFHKTKSTVLGFRDGSLLKIHKTDTIKHRFIDNYAVGEGLSNIEIEPLKPLYRISNSNLLLVDSLGIYDFKSVTIDWVLLRESPKIHLENLIKSLNPSRIIEDGSNYKNNAIMWKKTCANYGIKFHDTSVDGAFIVPLNL